MVEPRTILDDAPQADRNVTVEFLESHEACPACRRVAGIEPIAFADSKSQAFFEELASEITRPHVGDFYRDFIKALLRRATEKGLYK